MATALKDIGKNNFYTTRRTQTWSTACSWCKCPLKHHAALNPILRGQNLGPYKNILNSPIPHDSKTVITFSMANFIWTPFKIYVSTKLTKNHEDVQHLFIYFIMYSSVHVYILIKKKKSKIMFRKKKFF